MLITASSNPGGAIGDQIAWITTIVILCSIAIHFVSATPLMKWYEKHIVNRYDRVREECVK